MTNRKLNIFFCLIILVFWGCKAPKNQLWISVDETKTHKESGITISLKAVDMADFIGVLGVSSNIADNMKNSGVGLLLGAVTLLPNGENGYEPIYQFNKFYFQNKSKSYKVTVMEIIKKRKGSAKVLFQFDEVSSIPEKN